MLITWFRQCFVIGTEFSACTVYDNADHIYTPAPYIESSGLVMKSLFSHKALLSSKGLQIRFYCICRGVDVTLS